MAEEELVSGEGWISDDSSFYGDDDEQMRQHSICNSFNLRTFWRLHETDLNVVLAATKARLLLDDSPAETTDMTEQTSPADKLTTSSAVVTSDGPKSFLGDRRAMEEARLQRLGKRKREPSPEPSLFNPGQDQPDSWQLGESADDFVRRVPPLTTSVFTYSWIWAHNPHSRGKSALPRVDDFTSRGEMLLDQSRQNRTDILAKGKHGSKSVLSRSLNQESKRLHQAINDLAVECKVLSGKWMLFPTLEEVTRVWKSVVQSTISDRLGPISKVATDEGKPGDRLICIYTKDFRDEDDVLRVLKELETMALITNGRSIYYKSDAYTYLNLYRETATEYGLQASLYNSFKMMAAGKCSKPTASPKKKQMLLNSYF